MIRVLHMLPDLETGGGQWSVLNGIAGMAGTPVSHCICAVRPRMAMEPQFLAAGVDVEHLGYRGPASAPGALARLRRLIRRREIDLIHTNNTGLDRITGEAAALLRGLPLVNTLRSEGGYGNIRRTGRPSDLADALRRRIRRGLTGAATSHIISISEAVQASWAAELDACGIPASRRSVIHPGVDLDRFGAQPDPAPLARELGLEGRGPILLHVGRLVPGKGHAELLSLLPKVLGRWPRAVLLLPGEGPLRPELEAQAAALGVADAVKLPGNRPDVERFLALADLFVFPSVSEGFGRSFIEALASGTPIVSYDLPPFREIDPRGEASARVPLGDAGPLLRAVLEVLGDAPRLAEMGAAARRLAARFDRRVVGRMQADLYRAVLDGAPGRRRPTQARPVAD